MGYTPSVGYFWSFPLAGVNDLLIWEEGVGIGGDIPAIAWTEPYLAAQAASNQSASGQSTNVWDVDAQIWFEVEGTP